MKKIIRNGKKILQKNNRLIFKIIKNIQNQFKIYYFLII